MRTVLVVEDNSEVRELTATIVKSVGYGVEEAANGREALDAIERMTEDPCLILVDLTMPVMDGWTFLKELGKSHTFSPPVPVIVISAVVEDVVDGAWMVIRKPASPDALRQIIADVCGPP